MLFDSIRPKAINTEMERLIRETFGGGSTSSGVSVNSDSAMRLVTVYNCVKVLYNCISQMPCHLMQEVDEVKSKATEHPLFKIIWKRPNRWMTAPDFWGMAMVHVATRGNFIAFKTRYGDKIKELLPVAPGRLQEIIQNSDFSLTYKILTPDGLTVKSYSQDQILHLRGMSLDGYTGLNPIEYQRESLGLKKAGEQFLAQYFGKGLHPSAVVTHPAQLSAKTHADMRAAMKEKYAGLAKAQDFMLLDENMTIQFPSIKLVDAQFLELMNMSEAQICGMFGVPLILVQAGSTPATYASSAQFKQSFVDYTIAPIAVSFETAIDRDLLSELDQDRYYAKYNLGSLLRGNMAERFAAYAIGITNRFMNPNQARQLEDWNSYEGGDEYENPNTSSSKDTGDTGSEE